MEEYKKQGYSDLNETISEDQIEKNPITIDQLRPQIEQQLDVVSPKDKRVFIGGSYRNIAVLRYIAKLVNDFNDFKAILPIDLPKLSKDSYDHLIHDVSMEYLQGCSYAIFEVSLSDGHLMELERASNIVGLNVLLVFQQRKTDDEPIITRMVLSTKFDKKAYENFSQLIKIIGDYLK